MVEARALWITRFDWSTQAELIGLVESAADAGFNIIYFQVRGRGDALYRPGLEPWSSVLTGTLGADPGWDPLAAALDAAHARGLELHAWVNAFVAWAGNTPPESSPRHALLEHPDWLLADENGQPIMEGATTFFTPARAGVRERLAAVAADIARRYPVDGIHLDYIRYPASWPHDAASVAAYDTARASDPGLGFDEFRRRLVTDAVRLTADSLAGVRPAVRLSAAVWGIYRNTWGWSGVSTGYDDRLQDARAWAEDGLVDALVPMVYWPIQPRYGDRLDFAYLADEHAAAVAGRHMYIGITLENSNAEQLGRQIERAREAGAEGVAILSARLLREQDLWAFLASGPFRREAIVPPMPWKTQALALRR
ncbi:MAG TPA: family 10 glycosylhydrolase [Longimicrobiales bacterium]